MGKRHDNRRMAARLAVTGLLLAILVTLALSAPAFAAGVGVAPKRLDFDSSQGGATKKLYVINTGDEESLYRVYVDGEYSSWFRISPEEFLLYPDQNMQVSITLAPPWTARGDHATYIRVVSLMTSSELQIGTGVKVPARVSLSGPAPLLIIGIICSALVLAVALAFLIWRRTRRRPRRPSLKAGHGLLLLVLFLPAVVMSSCQSQTSQNPSDDVTVRVVATQDFGHQVMFDQTVKLSPGTPAISALEQVAEVETGYGGGFINAINGVSSEFSQGLTRDWFVYFNGVAADAGVSSFACHDGDVQHWDFHDWSFRTFVPATVGDFPEPFVHGYAGTTYPTVVVYADGFEGEATALGDSLSQLGVADLSTQHVSALGEADRRNSNLIVIGGTECSLVAEMNQAWDRLGFFVHFEDGSMVAHDATGNVNATYGPGSGVVQATQSPWNPQGVGACENVVWMVSGTDAAGVAGATDALINRYDQLHYACAVVVVDGHISKVPP